MSAIRGTAGLVITTNLCVSLFNSNLPVGAMVYTDLFNTERVSVNPPVLTLRGEPMERTTVKITPEKMIMGFNQTRLICTFIFISIDITRLL